MEWRHDLWLHATNCYCRSALLRACSRRRLPFVADDRHIHGVRHGVRTRAGAHVGAPRRGADAPGWQRAPAFLGSTIRRAAVEFRTQPLASSGRRGWRPFSLESAVPGTRPSHHAPSTGRPRAAARLADGRLRRRASAVAGSSGARAARHGCGDIGDARAAVPGVSGRAVMSPHSIYPLLTGGESTDHETVCPLIRQSFVMGHMLVSARSRAHE